MDLDEFFDNNEIVEKQEEVKKEEVKENGTKAGSAGNYTLTQFRDVILNDYNGGDDILSITQDSTYDNSNYMRIIILANDSQEINCQVVRNGMINQGYETVQGLTYIKYLMFDSSSDCIGLYYYRYSNSIGFYEVIPKTEQSIDNPTVSGNSIDYTEYFEMIIERLGGIEENVQSISDNVVSISNDISNGNYNPSVSVNTVSDNIMNKPLNQYNTQESISLFILLALVVGGLIYLIRKGLPSWH